MVEHNLSAVLGDIGDVQAAESAARRALAKGGDAAETWLVLGRALQAQGRPGSAEQAFLEALRRSPAMPAAHRDLAQLIWLRTGDSDAALSRLNTAMASTASPWELIALRVSALQSMRGGEAAYKSMPVLHDLTGAPAVLSLAAFAAASDFDPSLALSHANAAVARAPHDRSLRLMRTMALLGCRCPREALDELDRLPGDDTRSTALRLAAWRLLGDPRALAKPDYDRLVRSFELTTPAEYSDRTTWLAEVVSATRERHEDREAPFGQSVRGGTQGRADPRFAGSPAIDGLFQAIGPVIEDYLSTPGVLASSPASARLAWETIGAWSVVLRPGGRHVDHIHPDGWISSALHLTVPEQQTPSCRAGWIRFGGARFGVDVELEPEYWVRPQPGVVVLFPSWLWHGTEPFTHGVERMTIAFDVKGR